MYALKFEASRLPRTMTKPEWKVADRWRRVTLKQIAAEVERQRQMLGAFGSCEMHREMASDFISDMVNPPLLVYPAAGGYSP